MNKKLLAVLIATLPVAAMADVTVYGAVKVGVENVKTVVVNEKDVSVNKVADLGTKIGFKGNEDLGNGLKGIWQIESRISADGDQSGESRNKFATRDTFIGISSAELGAVKLGYNSNFSNSNMGIVNPWSNESAALGLDLFTRADTRLKNSIRFESPEMGGATIVIVHGLDETKGSILEYKATPSASVVEYDSPNSYVTNLGFEYVMGDFVAKYQYQTKNNAIGTKHDAKEQRLELGYTVDNLFVALGLAQSKSSISTLFEGISPLDETYYTAKDAAITAVYNAGKFTPKISYAKSLTSKLHATTSSVSDPIHYKQYILGVDYSLSKRTTAGISYGFLQLKTVNQALNGHEKSHERAFGLQVLHSF